MWIITRIDEEGREFTFCTNKRWERKPKDPVQFVRKSDVKAMYDFFPEDVYPKEVAP